MYVFLITSIKLFEIFLFQWKLNERWKSWKPIKKNVVHTAKKKANQKAKQDAGIATNSSSDSSGQGQTLRYIFYYY